jgi:hypothetical protein
VAVRGPERAGRAKEVSALTIKFDPANRVLTMSQTDQEHCGFNWDDFAGECFLSGQMDDKETEAAKGAFTFVVAMHKGLYK